MNSKAKLSDQESQALVTKTFKSFEDRHGEPLNEWIMQDYIRGELSRRAHEHCKEAFEKLSTADLRNVHVHVEQVIRDEARLRCADGALAVPSNSLPVAEKCTDSMIGKVPASTDQSPS